MGARPRFPPLQVVRLSALACELPAPRAAPLRRSRIADLTRRISAHPDAPPLSPSSIWRLLDQHLLKPWQQPWWSFPRDEQCLAKAGRVLALYAGCWDGEPLGPDDYVISADEKTSIPARQRCHPTTPPLPGQPLRGEHEYERGGARAYLAAWDVRRDGVIGRCEATTGKAPFGRLVDQVMQQAPFRSARRVCWIVANGSSQRGKQAARAVQARYPTLLLVHLPPPAAWLNQGAIYFSIIQRTVLTPNDFPDLAAVAARLRAVAPLYNDTARPFTWRLTRATLEERLAHLTPVSITAAASPKPALQQAA